MSFLAMGLGQVYNDQPRKALVLWSVLFAFMLLLRLSRIPTYFWGLVMTVIGMGLIWGYSIVDAVKTAKSTPAGAVKRSRRYVLTLAVVIVAMLLMPSSIVRSVMGMRAFSMPTASMAPGLHVGDHFMAKFLAVDAPIERGDILVFHYPLDPQVDYAKRVVGLPGESIELRRGQLIVDGRTEGATWAQYADRGASEARFGPFTVPDGCLFVLGDDLNNSADSRAWGALPREYVIGKALYVYYSPGFRRIGRSL